MNFEYKRKIIEAEDLTQPVVTIRMIPKPNQLDEVVVIKRSAPDDLIMVHKDHKKFTPAERKLYTARSGPVDIIVNALSGRTLLLKKELQIEFKERLLARVKTQYEDDFYIQTLKLPAAHIEGFQYFIIDDAEFVSALKAKNKTMMRFAIVRLASAYNEVIAAEKK